MDVLVPSKLAAGGVGMSMGRAASCLLSPLNVTLFLSRVLMKSSQPNFPSHWPGTSAIKTFTKQFQPTMKILQSFDLGYVTGLPT